MELIRINDQKLKIMLTASDMDRLELSTDAFSEDSRSLPKTVRKLLDEIKKKTDFEADDTCISVQYFPSKGGGCEMFISRLSNSGCSGSEMRKSEKTRALEPKRDPPHFHCECAYRFQTLQALLSACQRLNAVGYIESSDAYRDPQNRYYLYLTGSSPSPFSAPAEWNFLSEYGTPENAVFFRLYIGEYGHTICTNTAVPRLAALA